MKKMKQNKPLVRLLVVSWVFTLVIAGVINFGMGQNKCTTAACQKDGVMREIKKTIPVVNPLGMLWTKFM